jgi:ribonuclease HI
MQADKPVFPAGLYITLVADASFCHTSKAYGWCFWIKHGVEPRTIVKSGGGIGIANSGDAELEALMQGLQEIEALGTDMHKKYIVVQSDCTGALARLEPRLKQLVALGAGKAYTKHVKGHQGNKTPRNAVNTLCDRNAGQQMRRYRATYKGN